MNVVRILIEEIHNVEQYEADWTKPLQKKFVEVDMTTDIYGRLDRRKYVFNTEEWDKIKKQGFLYG